MNEFKIKIVLYTFIATLFIVNVHATVIKQNINQKTSETSMSFIPGDAVSISTFPDTTSFLNNIFPIDDKGFVEFPIEGKVKITDMTVVDLQSFLKEKFKAWLRNPNIYVKPVIRLSLLGGFRLPGLYYVDSASSLWDVIKMAGGPILEDGIYDLKWERNGSEQSDDLIKLFEDGSSLRQIGFQSGDQIWTKSPITETYWDTLNKLMPIVSISTAVFLAYITYQQTALQAR